MDFNKPTYVPISNLYPASYGISSATTAYYCFVCCRVSTVTGDHCCYCRQCCSLLRTPSTPVQATLSPKVDSISLPPPSLPVEIPKHPNFISRTSTTPFEPIFSGNRTYPFERNLPSSVPPNGPTWTTFESKVPASSFASPYQQKNVDYFVLAGDA